MEDKDLKELFSDFRPNLAPDANFMANLQKSLDKVELVKQHNRSLQRRNRRAALLAALAGFVTGALFILLLPYSTPTFDTITMRLPWYVSEIVSPNFRYILWLSAAFVMSAVSALGVYELSITQLKKEQTII